MERVDLIRAHGKHPQRRWRNGRTAGSNVTVVTFGRLRDGRWFAERHGRDADADDKQLGACVYAADELGRTLALRLAYRWMRDLGGQWTASPAAFDARGKAVDGLPWVRRGGEWALEP